MTKPAKPEDMEPIVLEPCWFCGTNKLEIMRTNAVRNEQRLRLEHRYDNWVYCRNCKAGGPIEGTVETAVTSWNYAGKAGKR